NLERASLVVAAWALYLKGKDENGAVYSIPDPRADFCKGLVADDALITERLLQVEEIFGLAIAQSAPFVAAFEQNLADLRTLGVSGTLEKLLAKSL
ncbi:D-mannonate oxidoreductase, partial [Pseudomonas viridiflava]